MTTLSIPIAAGTDDGNSGTGSGYINNGGGIFLGGYFGTANGWFRVVNVTIPSGSSVSNCTLTGTKSTSVGTADLKFRFVKEANPTYPTSDSDYNSRTLTTANATGSYSGTGAFTSANCATAAQEVIDQGAWSSGNAQMMFVTDNGSNANHGGFENRIELRSFDLGSGFASIDWTYTAAVASSVPVPLFLRIQNTLLRM